MKKLITICFATLFICAGANAQTTAGTKTPEKKTTKHKVIKALRSKATQAKLQKAAKEMRKEGE